MFDLVKFCLFVMILLLCDDLDFQVFMVKCYYEIDFVLGVYVFLGGKVYDEDVDLVWVGYCDGDFVGEEQVV